MSKRINWTDELTEEKIREVMNALNINRMPSNSECINVTQKTSLSNRIARTGGFYEWANRLGLDIKSSATQFAVKYEKLVKRELVDRGYDVELMSIKHPYDLLVNDGVKIDVKVARPYYGGSGRFHTFNLYSADASCDIYIAILLDKDEELEKLLIIPSKLLDVKQLSVGKESVYDEYIDRWDYIEKYAAFQELIV